MSTASQVGRNGQRERIQSIPEDMMSHTPEPWKTDMHRMQPDSAIWIRDGKGDPVASAFDFNQYQRDEEVEANAARIVACVNGCAGLNPAAYRECYRIIRSLVQIDLEVAEGHSVPPADVLNMFAARCHAALAHAEKPDHE